jgi:hypothetical protein
VGISKDRHARIIIMRPEITLHSEAGYIFAGCSRCNRFFLQFSGGPYSRVENRRSGFSLPVAANEAFAPSPQSSLAWLCFLFAG